MIFEMPGRRQECFFFRLFSVVHDNFLARESAKTPHNLPSRCPSLTRLPS